VAETQLLHMEEWSRELLLAQLTFTGAAQDCRRFTPNPFKKERCKECHHRVGEHCADAVSDDDIIAAIAQAQGADGGNIILSAENGMGELHLGGYKASSKSYIESRRITRVINAAKGLGSFLVGWAKQLPALEEQGVVFLRLEWKDTQDQKLYLEKPWDTLIEAVQFIENGRKAGGNVVVHCAQGKSRSSTVVIAYLMAKQGWTMDAALRFVQTKRPEAEPNPNFIEQLKEFERSTVRGLLIAQDEYLLFERPAGASTA